MVIVLIKKFKLNPKFNVVCVFLLFLLMSCSSAYAAASGAAAVLAVPTIDGPAADAPAADVPSVLSGGENLGGGIDLSGLDSTQTTPGFENIDTSQGDPSLQIDTGFGSDTSATTTTTSQADANAVSNAEPTAAEIDAYFEDILSSRTAGNPFGNLMRRLPRYGMSFFRRPPSTYAPADRVPVTQGYRIGVGDEMTLTVWGIPEEGNYRFTINRDGMAPIPHIGTVRLAGYTLPEAERIINARLSQYYTGFQMNLAMGRLGSILIYVTGNAQRPGAYTVSSFATLVNALLASGGPSANGSLRNIELKRNGKTVTVFDMYAMLLQGDKSQDAKLLAGDVIYIPPVGPLVGIAGEVPTPGVYELNGATRVKDLLYIAGGMKAQMFRGRIQYFRIYDNAYASAFEGSLEELENTELQDGDILRLYPVHSFTSTASIGGPVMRPGTFAIVPGHTRVSDLVERAGGLVVTASDIAEITRVRPSLEGPVNERFTINIYQAMQGDPSQNMTLENMDQITVLVIPDWKTQIRVGIGGEVKRPGYYSMFKGEKLSDLIEKAGGFTPKAFLRGAIFTRRSVAAEQRRSLNQMADRMERELLESMQNMASGGGATNNSTGAFNAEYQRRRQLIDNLRHIDIMGRVITKIDTPKNIKNTHWDYELQNGDVLRVPEVPLTVNVMGAVYTSSTQIYRADMGINGYINAAGGPLKSAHKRMLYLLKSDGTTIKLTRSTAMLTSKQWKAPHGYSPVVEPGDTIVVPVKYLDRQPIENFKDAIDIIYKVAVAVGVIIRN